MIQMVLIKQMVPSSKRRRNVFKSCWNEPRVKPIPLYKKVSSPWKVFWIPHTRERLAASVYLIMTIKNHCVCSGRWELLGAESCCGMCSESREGAKQPRARLVCRAQRAAEHKEPHLAPLSGGEKLVPISSRAISHRGYWGDKGRSSVCPGREGFVLPGLPWLSLAAFAPGLILEAARSLGILEQICNWTKKRRAVVLCQAHFFFCVVGFLFLVLRFWFLGCFGCGLMSSQSSVALTLWEFFFHSRAF